MSQLDGLKLVLLIVSFRGYFISADREPIPVNDTRIFFIHGPKYEDHTTYTLYEADKLAQDPKFQNSYTTLYMPDLYAAQYADYHPIAEAYATLPDVNFLQVYWGYDATDDSDAKQPDVEQLKPLVGDFVIQLLNYVPYKDFRLLAFSTGVEVAARVTRDHIEKTGKRLPRLTVLELPFYQKIVEKRLKGLYNRSAEFIDVIHTASYNQGTILSIAHADFWPNGGITQPGCTPESEEGPLGCSHVRAAELYAESVRNRDSGPQFCSYGLLNIIHLFQRKTLGTPVIMGINCDPSARGDYFLLTNGSPPYALDWCPM